MNVDQIIMKKMLNFKVSCEFGQISIIVYIFPKKRKFNSVKNRTKKKSTNFQILFCFLERIFKQKSIR